jgi:hypothetical protein
MLVRAGPALAGLAAPGMYLEFARSLLAIDTAAVRMFPGRRGASRAACNSWRDKQLQFRKISGITNGIFCV